MEDRSKYRTDGVVSMRDFCNATLDILDHPERSAVLRRIYLDQFFRVLEVVKNNGPHIYPDRWNSDPAYLITCDQQDNFIRRAFALSILKGVDRKILIQKLQDDIRLVYITNPYVVDIHIMGIKTFIRTLVANLTPYQPVEFDFALSS